MRIAAFDLASRTGVAFGSAGATPKIEAWQLRTIGESPEEAAATLGNMLDELFRVETFGLVAVENYLNPAAQPNADAVISGIMLRGALEAVASHHGITVEGVDVATIRKHFCGRATVAAPRRGNSPPRSAKQKAADRLATKEMVWRRAVALGYFSRDESPDYDRSDAVAVWDHAVATFSRVIRPFVMFGGA